MGTRSTTKIYQDKELLLAIYKQYDGYIKGWGEELKQFIKSGKFVNGMPLGNKQKIFNGMGDFALQLVCHFKNGEAGGIYATTEDDKQEYNYIVEWTTDKKNRNKGIISIRCLEDKDYGMNKEVDLS